MRRTPSDPAWWPAWMPDPEPVITHHLVAFLAPSDDPLTSRHAVYPDHRLPRPDVLLLEVHHDGGAILRRYTADGEYGGESWHESIEQASDEVAEEYGAGAVGPWEPVPEAETQPRAYAIAQADARRRWPLGSPGDRMTAEQWRTSDDVPAMLRALRAGWAGPGSELVRLVHRYLLASCRRIWRLLPMEASRRGVEVAESYLAGRATANELHSAEYQAEGAAFFLEPEDPATRDERLARLEDPLARQAMRLYEAERRAVIARLVQEVEAIPREELGRMYRPGPGGDLPTPHELLSQAAYFADMAILYSRNPAVWSVREYEGCLCAEWLREIAGAAFRPSDQE